MKGLSRRKYEVLRKTVYFSFSLPSLGFLLILLDEPQIRVLSVHGLNNFVADIYVLYA